MNLSATRNRIIRINLMVTVAAFALTACIVPASFFGMNINHGVEVGASTDVFSPCNPSHAMQYGLTSRWCCRTRRACSGAWLLGHQPPQPCSLRVYMDTGNMPPRGAT